MIVCSCNVLSDNQIYSHLTLIKKAGCIPSVSDVMAELGMEVQCATCSNNVKKVIRSYYNGGTEDGLGQE